MGTASVTDGGAADSAEWIVENPGLSANGVRSHQGTLANFGTITFTNAEVAIGGGASAAAGLVANDSTSDAGLLIIHNRVAAAPSSPTSASSGDTFAVAYGSTPAAQPS